QGEEFLQYAKKILSQVDEVEAMYRSSAADKQRFTISVPRASYISFAFTEFAKHIDTAGQAEIFYKETNSMRAIDNILQADYKLGIIRYQTTFEQYFKVMLHEKGLASEVVGEFSYLLLMSKDHPLADREGIEFTDLSPYIEIAHADPYVPSLPLIDVKKAELSEFVDKRIFVFERGSQFELLSNVTNTFMWVSPIPQRLLERYDLVLKQCSANTKRYRDVLIYRMGYHFSALDKLFIEELATAKDNL
ncbi:MAG: LysR family transcriptional regulator, partial [Acetanaerobacterium sp.]